MDSADACYFVDGDEVFRATDDIELAEGAGDVEADYSSPSIQQRANSDSNLYDDYTDFEEPTKQVITTKAVSNGRQDHVNRGTSDHKYVDNDEMSRAMYRELQLISAQLKTKNMELCQRGQQLEERARMLDLREENLDKEFEKLSVHQKSLDHQTANQLQIMKERLSELQLQLKEKNKENKRLRTNYDALQDTSSQRRKQLEELQISYAKLERQSASYRQRIENLQRCQEYRDKQTENILAEIKTISPCKAKRKSERSDKSARRTSSSQALHGGSSNDVLVTLVDWTVQDILKPSYERGKTLDTSLRSHILENCQKMIPSMAEIVRSNQTAALSLSCLQFTYWSCLLLDQCSGKQNVGLGSTLRKLSEDLYRPMRTDENSAVISSVFVKSSDLHIRMLSYLLLLRTLTQADCMANVMTLLKQDLRDELAKELFVHYHGTGLLLRYFKPTSKAHLSAVLDTYLLMCVESTMLRSFLGSCSTEDWFRSVAMVLKIPGLEEKHLEKISVILQKLSKLKENRKLFDAFALRSAIQDKLHNLTSSDSNSFLQLNLKSVLFNLSTVS